MRTTPPPFIPVEGRQYAATLETAEVGEWLIVRDVNENHGSVGAKQCPQVEVVARTAGQLVVKIGWSNKKIGLGKRKPEARGRIDHFSKVQTVAEHAADGQLAADRELLQKHNLSPWSLPAELASQLADVVRAWDARQAR